MKVAVFSGSFNPMHIGHIAIVRYLLDNGGFDKVYLVVSPQNPFKAGSDIEMNSDTRLEDAKRAIEANGLSGLVRVDDIEFDMPLPSYTIRTLDELQRREPGNSFTLVIGADNLAKMLDWKEGERILTQYGLAVYPRVGCNMGHDRYELCLKHREYERESGNRTHRPCHIKIMKDAPVVEVSSTQIRDRMSRGENVSTLLA